MGARRFVGDTSLGGWVVGWLGQDGIYYEQRPELRVRLGPIEVQVDTPSPYLVAAIRVTEAGAIHHVALNPVEEFELG